MAEGLKIVIGADVTGAVAGLSNFNKKLADTDDIVSDVIKGSSNLEDALDKLGKQGLLSINSLGDSIKDFKAAFQESTNPEDTKKFGDALKVLEERQKQLIDSGLRVAEAETKVTASHAAHTAGANKLSNSIFGLSKIFNVLPPELSHLTHGFDQVLQSYESVTKGTESASDKVGKFASALGSVGLGLAISVAAGLLVGFVTELLNTDAALEKATEEGIRFSEAISRIDENIKASKENIKFIGELSDLNVDINFGKGFEADLLKVRGGFEDLRQEAFTLGESLKEARKISDEAFKSMQEGISDAGRAATAAFPLISKVPDAAIKGLSEADKKLIENAKSTAAAREKIQDDIFKNEQAQELQRSRIRLVKTEEERKQEKERNDALRGLLESRANIIKEFTAKFASIKDPFPSFFTKNLPLGKVEDKTLRAALDNAFKVLSDAATDLFNTKRIDPGTVPLEIHFKPEIVGKSDLVRAIEENFGDLKKDVEDAVNKGIFEAHFKVVTDGTELDSAALDAFHQLEDSLKSLTGQLTVETSVDFDVNKFDLKKAMDQIARAKHLLAVSAAADTIKFKINAQGEVKIEINKEKIFEDLAREINQAIVAGANTAFAGIGEALGEALSNNLHFDALRTVVAGLSGILSDVGKALIKSGVLLLGLQNAIKKISTNPALAIGLGIALVALSRVLQNSIRTAGSREVGGPVAKGLMYLVNERGREIYEPNNGGKPMWIPGGKQYFQPMHSGNIIPAHKAEEFAINHGIKRLADGGITTGPTFALIGERGPEFIAPVKSLNSLGLNGNPQLLKVQIEGRTSGRDIKYVNAREDRHQNRTT